MEGVCLQVPGTSGLHLGILTSPVVPGRQVHRGVWGKMLLKHFRGMDPSPPSAGQDAKPVNAGRGLLGTRQFTQAPTSSDVGWRDVRVTTGTSIPFLTLLPMRCTHLLDLMRTSDTLLRTEHFRPWPLWCEQEKKGTQSKTEEGDKAVGDLQIFSCSETLYQAFIPQGCGAGIWVFSSDSGRGDTLRKFLSPDFKLNW